MLVREALKASKEFRGAGGGVNAREGEYGYAGSNI